MQLPVTFTYHQDFVNTPVIQSRTIVTIQEREADISRVASEVKGGGLRGKVILADTSGRFYQPLSDFNVFTVTNSRPAGSFAFYYRGELNYLSPRDQSQAFHRDMPTALYNESELRPYHRERERALQRLHASAQSLALVNGRLYQEMERPKLTLEDVRTSDYTKFRIRLSWQPRFNQPLPFQADKPFRPYSYRLNVDAFFQRVTKMGYKPEPPSFSLHTFRDDLNEPDGSLSFIAQKVLAEASLIMSEQPVYRR